MEQVTPLPSRGSIFGDVRDDGRGLRVSWHPELGCVVLSVWKDDACVATARVATADVPRLINVLVEGLATQTTGPAANTRPA